MLNKLKTSLAVGTASAVMISAFIVSSGFHLPKRHTVSIWHEEMKLLIHTPRW